MFENMSEQQAREQILELTAQYYEKYHKNNKDFKEGDRTPYASRVYDSDEMVNLVDSALEFRLTSGRFTEQFETDMQAAVGLAQLKKMPSFSQKRRENFAFLRKELEVVSDKLILPDACPNSDPCWFGFLMTCRDGSNRNKIVRYVESKGIQTRMLFAGNITKHPCFDTIRNDDKIYKVVGSLENTDKIMSSSFWIGVYPGMTEEKLAYMCKTIISAVNGQAGV